MSELTKRVELSPGALLAPLPAVLVTSSARIDGRIVRDIITVAWTGIICTHPALTYISLRPGRYSYRLIKSSGEFVINLPTADISKKVDLCGMLTGAKVDKFARCGFESVESSKVSAPTIAQCPLALECRLRKPEGVEANPLPLGTHDMFFAEITAVTADAGIMGENGRLRLDKANLLGYIHGEYFAAGKYSGKYGFSVKKNK